MAVALQACGVRNATYGDYLPGVNLGVPVAGAVAREGRNPAYEGISVRPNTQDTEKLRTKSKRSA